MPYIKRVKENHFTPMNFKALALTALASLSLAAPAAAELTRLPGEYGGHAFAANDAQGKSHLIETVRKDKDGDYLIEVIVDNGPKAFYWIDCTNDTIQVGNTWKQVDHRKMEGHYADATCRPEMGTSIAYQNGWISYEEDRDLYYGRR